MSYAGESWAKKIARAHMLRSAALWLIHRTQDHRDAGGEMVTLAGPSAVEWRFLDHIASTLRVRTTSCRVVLVDRDERGLRVAQEQGFTGTTHHGNVEDYLAATRSVSFAHLDLMGPLSVSMGRTIRALTSSLAPGSFFAITFLRGRERAGDPVVERSREITKLAGVTPGVGALRGRDHERFLGGWRVMSGWLGVGYHHSVLGVATYDSGRSPMGMLWGCRLAKSDRCARCNLPSMAVADVDDDDDYNAKKVRDAVIDGPPWVAMIYGVRPSQAAAWKAVATRTRAAV